jgi:hypothetical protein
MTKGPQIPPKIGTDANDLFQRIQSSSNNQINITHNRSNSILN